MPRERGEYAYKLFICYAPSEGRDVARYLQLALQRALRGMVVEEIGHEVEGVHTQDDLDELLHAIEQSEAVMLVAAAALPSPLAHPPSAPPRTCIRVAHGT